MAMHEERIDNAKILEMFIKIKSAELRNVRTLEYDDKEMVRMLTNYIKKETARMVQSSGED